MIAAGGPVIPNFGQGSSCVTGDNLFCWDWVKEHWGDTLQPALVLHIELTAIAVVIGSVLAFGLALLAHRRRRTEQPISIVVRARLHVPEHRALPAARPVHRPDLHARSRSRSSPTRS